MKNFLIHLLGGFTESELEQESKAGYFDGTLDSYAEMLDEANNLYGKSSDEWCTIMYTKLASKLNKLLEIKHGTSR